MRFLHAADLHLDSPLKGLDRYDGAPVERLRTATRHAFENLVDYALAERVDFILLAGDTYDRDWQDFHTGLFFRSQMVRLDRAGIPVFMVQGNHDAQGVISRQLTLPDNVTVFSSHTPQTHRLESLRVAIHGRSFPNREVSEDWVPSYPEPLADYFNIGLLHTSLSGRPGHDPYAPTDLETLKAKGYDYWALGHVHRRERVCQAPWIVYPGNLQGRHANETGEKGCERIWVEGGQISAEFMALDVVRWHHLSLDLHGVADLAALRTQVLHALKPRLQQGLDRLHALRITLTGISPLYILEAQQPGTLEHNLRAALQELELGEVWLEQVKLALSAPQDRAQLAEGEDAIGELVRLVDTLCADPEQARALVHSELKDLSWPEELLDSDAIPKLHCADTVRALLLDAEATVIARLSQAPRE